MNIGKNIRTLRKKRDISQEMLAERLGVTFQAISNWEREESHPDITLLPSIANFFGVTVDKLLGIEEEKEQEEIRKIIERCQDYDIHYEGEKLRQTIAEGMKRYPGNFQLMAWYVYSFQKENPQRAIEVGQYVLDNCTDNEIRSWINRSVIYAYKNSDNVKRAIELAKKLPTYNDTSQDVLRACLTGKEQLEHVQHMIFDLAYEFWYSIRQIRYNYNADEQIALFKKSNDIYDAIYETDDMPIKLTRKMRNYQGMAEVSLTNGDVENGMKYMEKAVDCAVTHDELPEIVYSKSILFNQHAYNRKYEATMSIKEELLNDFETEDEFYKEIRPCEQYKKMIDVLKSR